jgi:hypothetical protein
MKKNILLIVFLLFAVLGFSQVINTIFYQPFGGNSLPTGWSIYHTEGSVDFTFGSGVVPGSVADFPSNAAIFDDDAVGNGQHNVAYLASPFVDLTNYYAVYFEFYYALNVDGNGEYLEVGLYDLTTSLVIAQFDTDTDPTSITYQIRSAALNAGMDISNIRVYFKFDDNNSWSWGCGIDSIHLSGYSYEHNDCNNAKPLTVGNRFSNFPVTDNYRGITASGETPIPSCGDFGSGRDLWYSVVVPYSGNLIVETKGNTLGLQETVITAYSGSCGGLTEIECDDTDVGGDSSKIVLSGLTPGETILIRMFENGNDQEGSFRISAYDFSPPENDDCINAISIDDFYYDYYHIDKADAYYATNGSGFVAPNGCGNGMNDGVWYTFTAKHSGEVTVRVSEVSFSPILTLGVDSWDAEIGIYTGTCDNLSCVDYVDNFGLGEDETITFPVVYGTTYYVNVGESSHNVDNPEAYFDLRFSYSCGGTAPTNDLCSSAWNISSIFSNGTYTNTIDATCATGGGIGICTDDMNDGVWFKLIATENGELEFTITPDLSWDPQIGVYSGSCGVLSCVTTVDNGFYNGVPETVNFDVVSGETYFINVGHWNPTNDLFEGPFQINGQFDSTAAVSNETISDLEIYPNPVTNIINIKAQNNIDKISVFNQIGRLIKVLSPNNKTIQADLSNLTSGIYILKINSDNKITTKKIIKI